MAKASTTSISSDDDWRVEEDMRTLARAEEIRKDPKRLKAALAKAREKIAELQSLQTPGKK
ncbi:hypothetical protein [Delftia lacustris]|uniref:Uncharacterized protein n=1 Tax=Delftia lacustris TaxID=558537 RepID=A0A1H3QTD3_9BURK|nr:hypothetical protein [Delftia lacustris]SDZ16852.1 hypothetical protein SAMN05421547_113143 [Delftia lacustris]